MINNNFRSKAFLNKNLILEGLIDYLGDLIEIKSTRKEEIIKEIVENSREWLNNKKFEKLRKEKLDLAIVVYVNKLRMKRQDVDNIAKVVLDALKKDKNKPDKPYLYEDDSQIVRLLIYKLERTESDKFDTSAICISFRKHDPNKQMILKELSTFLS